MNANKSRTSSLKMQKKKGRSSATIGRSRSDVPIGLNDYIPPCDTLTIKIMSLRLADEDPKHFAIKVTYFDQLILTAIIKSIGAKDEDLNRALTQGTLVYDPSDYEKMCLYADTPLVELLRKHNNIVTVNIQPLKSIDDHAARHSMSSSGRPISSCNVDILSIFLGDEEKKKMCVKKRMEPMKTPSMKHRKSWDTLPLITIEISVERHLDNAEHHKVLKDANWMKLTLIAAYNMYIPFEDEYVYSAASKTPLYCDSRVGLVTYCQGYREPRRFNCTSFYPKWESLRVGGDLFTKGDQKLHCNLEDIQNEDNIDLPYYLNRILPYHTAVWGSFHRTLMLKDTDKWLYRHIRNYKWPLEVHIYGDNGGYSFMAFLNLFQLLFPGETTVCLAVPLNWINSATMKAQCDCDLLLTPNEKMPSISSDRLQSPSPTARKASKTSKVTSESGATSVTTLTGGQWKATGADDNYAFVVVEVKLGRPLKNIVKPPRIFKDEISDMLTELEEQGPRKRICSGRGQLERDWQNTVRSAANSLRRVPYYGTTEFCTFNRQLSETRTRVEVTTSCWQEAAIFMNNNFVVQQYLHSDETFEELVMMAHACMMRIACKTLIDAESWRDLNPIHRAARHARQVQDTYHAMELYMRLVVDKSRNPDYWRELSTCLKDIDKDWANACLNKAVVLDPRHPLTLLSKGATLFETDPTAAEPFFSALLAYHPIWTTVWVVASAYYYERELYHMADITLKLAVNRGPQRIPEEVNFVRNWEQELGDWWDSTPLLPGMSLFFDAADLLLRLRAIPLAEVCLARALVETGPSAAYYHLIALCWRLRGDYQEALCHLNLGIEMFGEVNYLRSLEAECQHKLGNIKEAMSSFNTAGSCLGAFSILMSMPNRDAKRARNVLVDLVRRQPSAYAWIALAEDWLKRFTPEGGGDPHHTKMSDLKAAKSCSMASAIQALKMDRRAGRAWALLASLVKPSARRLHCLNMANMCGWEVTAEDIEKAVQPSIHSLCHMAGKALRECKCQMCDNLRM